MGATLFAVVSGIKSRIELATAILPWRAILIATAVVALLFAVLFVIAAYHALTDLAGVTPIEAAGLVGGSLVCVGVLVLAVLPLVAKGNGDEWELIFAPGAGLALVDKGLAKATGQIGALPVLAIAFAVWFLASRR